MTDREKFYKPSASFYDLPAVEIMLFHLFDKVTRALPRRSSAPLAADEPKAEKTNASERMPKAEKTNASAKSVPTKNNRNLVLGGVLAALVVFKIASMSTSGGGHRPATISARAGESEDAAVDRVMASQPKNEKGVALSKADVKTLIKMKSLIPPAPGENNAKAK